MKTVHLIIVAGFLFSMFQCSPTSQKQEETSNSETLEVNPPAPGFDQANSDPEAVEIADRVMEAMGGRTNWDQTRFLAWNFFGRRHLTWDKWTDRVRIEIPGDDLLILVNVGDLSGTVKKGGSIQENSDSLTHYLGKGKSIWINDSYWLVMPFKLKDSGVTLKYLGEGKSLSGDPMDILGLTFEGVGDTPQNRYEIGVDKESDLVCQWAFFKNAEDTLAAFTLPWKNYKQYGNILLSGDREKYQLSEIQVFDSLPDQVFESTDPVDLENL